MIKPYYIIFLVAALFLIGVGLLIERVGGVGVRTDGVSSSVSLSFSEPMLRGSPVRVYWQGQEEENFGVTIRIVTASETLVLGSEAFLTGSMRVAIPCTLPAGPSRLELVDTQTQAMLAVRPITVLPPGPDCVR